MRTWTFAFLAVATLVVLATTAGSAAAMHFVARVIFLAAVVAALLAAIRSATLQMVHTTGGLPPPCPVRRVGGRRCEDAGDHVDARDAATRRDAATAGSLPFERPHLAARQ